MMTDIGRILYAQGFILRSGGATGADSAFEEKVSDHKEIYLPFPSFNGRKHDNKNYFDYVQCSGNKKSEETVFKYHPNPSALSYPAFCMMSRNAMQILGSDMKTPTDFVICWTKNGKSSGGTGQALRIAESLGIKILNLHHSATFSYFQQWIQSKKTLL